MRNVLIIDGNYEYNNLFTRLGFTLVNDVGTADLVCFTGGEDVSPELYGDAAHQYTYNNTYRDGYEGDVFERCVSLGIPMVGICRGGQFLNVMNGGRMYQHVDSHTAPHFITDLETGEEVYVSSTHHQMMMPSPEGLLVASSALHGHREWYDGVYARADTSNQDIEVVYYKETNSLCFQPHPEFQSEAYEGMFKYFENLLARYTFRATTQHQFSCTC